jgi:hypothetical protein
MIEGTESLDDEVALDCVALQTVFEELESINGSGPGQEAHNLEKSL